MANSGRSEERGETSLAAATAAIITARWGAPPRRATTPEPDRLAGDEWTGGGRATATATRPVAPPLQAPSSTAEPVGYGAEPAGYAADASFAPDPVGYAADSSFAPDPVGYAADSSFAPDAAGYAPDPVSFAPDTAFAPDNAFAPPDYVPPGRGYAAEPVSSAPSPSPMPAPPMRTPMAAPVSAAPMAPPAPVMPSREPYRGVTPPPMFTPATAVPATDLFAAAVPAPPTVPHPYPRPDYDAPPPPSIPTQRSGDSALFGGLDVPIPPVPAARDDFADSVMSGIAFPEPFIPEPYEPDFGLNGFGSDGGSAHGNGSGANGYGPSSHGAGSHGTGSHGTNGYGTNGHGTNGHGSNGHGGFSAFGSASVREPELVHAGGAREPLLPRRVPSIPDVPDMFLPNDPGSDGFELTRIASFLRDERLDATDDRPDGFDVAAVLEAVRRVRGVSQAQLRWNTGYGHTLRVEFVEGANEGEVTREVARMLRESMGVAAQPGPVGTRLSPDENTLDRVRRSAAMAGASAPLRAVRTDGSARVLVDHVQVTMLGVDATVDVRLTVSGGALAGTVAKASKQGPGVDAYLLRLAASAAADAVDQLLLDPVTNDPRGRCFVEHVAVVPFGGVEVAVVVMLLTQGSMAEQVSGSALVTGDPREAVVRATLSAANRRLEHLLS